MSGYLWIKTLHVLAIISWMAGLLYLPRLFVYHVSTQPGSEASETFKVMERRLFRAIMRPAMVVAWASGLWMAWDAGLFRSGWFHLKLFSVVLMTVVHEYLGTELRRFAADNRMHEARFYRVLNEVPTLLMIVIVAMVIVKPF